MGDLIIRSNVKDSDKDKFTLITGDEPRIDDKKIKALFLNIVAEIDIYLEESFNNKLRPFIVECLILFFNFEKCHLEGFALQVNEIGKAISNLIQDNLSNVKGKSSCYGDRIALGKRVRRAILSILIEIMYYEPFLDYFSEDFIALLNKAKNTGNALSKRLLTVSCEKDKVCSIMTICKTFFRSNFESLYFPNTRIISIISVLETNYVSKNKKDLRSNELNDKEEILFGEDLDW